MSRRSTVRRVAEFVLFDVLYEDARRTVKYRARNSPRPKTRKLPRSRDRASIRSSVSSPPSTSRCTSSVLKAGSTAPIILFRSKRADRVKMLVYEGTGLVLIWKRLEGAKFKWPARRLDVLLRAPTLVFFTLSKRKGLPHLSSKAVKTALSPLN
jgi:hypothetical protein